MSVSENLGIRYVRRIKEALKAHGEYTYHDKGPQEVMDIPADKLQTLTVDEVSDILEYVIKKSKKHGPRFVQTCLVEMQEWDKFDELLASHEWLCEHF